MPEQKKIPLRMCSGCMARLPKKELRRIVRDPEGVISLDSTGKKSGRGAYVCPKEECLKKARKKGRLERALKCSIPEEVYLRLKEAMEAENAG